MKSLFFLAAVFVLLVYTAAASSVTVIEPFNATVNQGGSVLLGKVGPGQTFYVIVSANTTNSSGVAFSRGWNKLVASGLPPGWIVENSSLYGAELSIEIDPAPNAQNGTYAFNLTAINIGNYSHLGAVEFKALINVTPNVFNLQISPTNVSAGPGQPASVYVTIDNTGVSDSPFMITVHGLPAWNSSQSVIALHHTTETFTYQVYENEPGTYRAQLDVNSGSSPLVYKKSNLTLVIQPSLLNDYRAVGQGAIAFPVVYQPVYAIMYLVSRVLAHLGIK